MSTNQDRQNQPPGRLPPGATGNLYTEPVNSFKGYPRPPLARKDHNNILPSPSYHFDPAFNFTSSATFTPSINTHSQIYDHNTIAQTHVGPPFDLRYKTIRALPYVNARSYTVHCGSRPFQGTFDQPFWKNIPEETFQSTCDFPLTPTDLLATPQSGQGSDGQPQHQRHPLLPPISLELQDPAGTHSRNSSLTSLFSSTDSASLPGIYEISPLETASPDGEEQSSRTPLTHPSQRDTTAANPTLNSDSNLNHTLESIFDTEDDLQTVSELGRPSQGPSFASRRRFTHISDPGPSTSSYSIYQALPPAPPLPASVPPLKAQSRNEMSVLAMRADPLLSDGVVSSPFPPASSIRFDDQTSHDLNGWLGSTQPYIGHERQPILDVSRGSMSSSSLSSLSDEQLDDEPFQGQRVGQGDPLSGYNTQGEKAGEGSSELWSYDQAIDALIGSSGVLQNENIDKDGPSTLSEQWQQHKQRQLSIDQHPLTIEYSTPTGPLKAKAMFAAHTPQNEQQGMNYPSQPLGDMERPLPTPSAAVPIGGGEHLQNVQNQDQQQYLVPVVQRGEHLFYDPEYPITSAASYTFGANAQQNHHHHAGGYQRYDGQGMGRQPSMSYGGQQGSRSAHENISQQNFVTQIPRSYHGYSYDQRNTNGNFNGPVSAFPGSAGQLPSALGSAFPHLHEAQDGNNLIIPTHHIQPSRSQENLNAMPPPVSAYPQTPSPNKRGGSAMSSSFGHAQMLRSAAPEPEGPSAFMMAYQGGCTPQSVGQGRHPPSSASRFDEVKMEMHDGYGETPEYEIERMRNIRANEQLMESLGLGSSPSASSLRAVSRSPSKMMKRKTSSMNVKANPGEKKSRFKNRVPSMGPVRSSTRLASMSRTVSYANLGDHAENSSDESFDSNEMDEREDEWDGSDSEEAQSRRRKRNGGSRRQASGRWPQSQARYNRHNYRDPTLRDLVEEHPDLRTVFPLFYNIITEDLIIDNNAFPLIGSVPSSSTPVQKAGYLQQYYHKGRRAIAQLDAFTARCDKRYDGPGQKWVPLTPEMKIAIRDIRRKAVERCENYKYTRRDLLNKHVGKGKWAPIEDGWISWNIYSTSTDPANDLEGVHLASPPPESESGSQQSMASSRNRAVSRKRSQAFGRKASRGDMNRNASLRLHTNDIFNNGYSDERSHVGMAFPSVPMKQNGDNAYTPVTPQRQGTARFNPMYTHSPTQQYNFSPGLQDTPLNVVTPSIVRAARFASNNQNPLGSPFGTPASAGVYQSQSQQGTPTHHIHHVHPQQLFAGTPLAEQEPAHSVVSHPMSMDEGMMTGGMDMSYRMSEVVMQASGENGNGNVNGNGNGFNEQSFTNGI